MRNRLVGKCRWTLSLESVGHNSVRRERINILCTDIRLRIYRTILHTLTKTWAANTNDEVPIPLGRLFLTVIRWRRTPALTGLSRSWGARVPSLHIAVFVSDSETWAASKSRWQTCWSRSYSAEMSTVTDPKDASRNRYCVSSNAYSYIRPGFNAFLTIACLLYGTCSQSHHNKALIM